MTERWSYGDNPSKYWEYNWYSDHLPARKFYFFLAEIGRQLRRFMTDSDALKMLDFCEQCAEGYITEHEISDLSDEHRPAAGENFAQDAANHLYFWVADRHKVGSRGVDVAVNSFAFVVAVEAGLLQVDGNYNDMMQIHEHPVFAAARERTELEWGEIVREIYGPDPFNPLVVPPEWRTSTVMQLARHIYETRDFNQMPILADALQDAGCDNVDILSHCRDTSLTHVRGCWVVDLVLGKS